MFQCWIFAIPETDCVFAQNCLECNTLQNLWSCITTNRGTCRQHRTTPRLNKNPARAIVLIKIFDTSRSTNCCRYKLRTDSAQVFRKSHLHNSIRFCWTRWEFHDNKQCLWGTKTKTCTCRLSLWTNLDIGCARVNAYVLHVVCSLLLFGWMCLGRQTVGNGFCFTTRFIVCSLTTFRCRVPVGFKRFSAARETTFGPSIRTGYAVSLPLLCFCRFSPYEFAWRKHR
jgi:hypothetical protein